LPLPIEGGALWLGGRLFAFDRLGFNWMFWFWCVEEKGDIDAVGE
jgi:hypothetical protein